MNINPDKIEKLITNKTTAIVPVHVFGTPCNVNKIQKIADKYKLKVVYDAAHAFGTEIANHQVISFMLADMATQIEAARFFCLKSAWLKDQHKPYGTASAMAKVHASETAMWVTTKAVQIHGGYGYVKEYHVERLMRDAKLTEIYEGTSEIQRIVISRSLLRD